MDFSDNYTEEEDTDLFQLTTNEDSTKGIKYKKWLNSNTDISHISSIFRLEQENLNEKQSELDCLKENKKREKKNECAKNKKKEKIENSEENIEIEDELLEKVNKLKSYDENVSKETFEDSNNIRKNYKFIWDEGGSDVKVTGSFSDWKIQFQMTREQNGQIFTLQLPLGNEIYQYKFIVDGEWKYSKKYPTQVDGMGNINNILDNTNNVLVRPKEKINRTNKKKKTNTTKKNKKTKKAKSKKNTKKSRMSTKTKTTKTRASTINKESIKIVKKNSIYKSEYPSDDDILPLPLPNELYYESFKLESFTNQSSIGNKNYYDYYDRYCLYYIASSKPIFLLGHVNLNHLISTNHNKSNNIKNSMSFRYREKASTFIYYNINKT